jgi:hypothetical protein
LSSGRSVVLGGANVRIEDTDAVVVESSQDVNGAEEVRVPLLQRGGGGGGVIVVGGGSAHSERQRWI